MRSNRLLRICFSCALVAGLTALTLHGQNTTQESAASNKKSPNLTADARTLLDKVSAAYAKLTALDLSGNVSIAFDGAGQHRNDHAEFTGAFRSPNQFRHDMKNEATIVSTGDKLYTFIPRKNVYETEAAPKSRADGLPGEVTALLMDQDPSLALALTSSATDLLTASANDVTLGDEQTLDGVHYQTLEFALKDEDETVLIDPQTHLLRRAQHDLRRSMKRQNIPNVNVALVTVDYTRTQIATLPEIGQPATAQLQNVSFDWTPPADAKPFTPAPQAAGDDTPAAAVQLEGKAAPAFTIKDMDGKSVSLSDLKGSVVILDFWATWCGPCRQGLPHIDKIAKDRAADGVKAFAVNLQEDATQIKPFVQQTGLSLPVLLDSDGAVAQKYQADAIPETVIIDKNGTVQKVIVGLVPDEEKVVNDQIDSALKAK